MGIKQAITQVYIDCKSKGRTDEADACIAALDKHPVLGEKISCQIQVGDQQKQELAKDVIKRIKTGNYYK